jgi:hypothetical protein
VWSGLKPRKDVPVAVDVRDGCPGLSAVLAVVLWPLILLGVNLHVRR